MSKEQERAELHRTIWAIANDLRGSVDGWDFKNYILGFLFYRFISEDLTAHLNATEEEAGNSGFNYATDVTDDEIDEEIRKSTIDEKGFFIYPSELFQNVAANAESNEDLNITLASIFKNIEGSAIGTASEQDMKGLFSDIDVNSPKLGATTAKRNELLAKIMLNIGQMNLGGDLRDAQIDAFGDAYEYLMTMYASNAGKSGGEFFTPQEVAELLARIACDGKNRITKVYDPACGSGSLLLKFAKVLGPNKAKAVSFYGQEINITTYNLCRINMFLHHVPFNQFDIELGDTLIEPKHLGEIPFDAIVSNPPYSTRWAGDDNPLLINDDRFSPAGVLAPKTKADLAFTMHILYNLSTAGTAAIVEFPGVLYRSGAEQKIRQYLIENNYIDAVILLPSNLFFGVGIPTCIIVLKKSKSDSNVLFINASNEFIKEGNKNKLLDENIDYILELYKAREDVEFKSRLVSNIEILHMGANLHVSTYIAQEDTQESLSLEELNGQILDVTEEIISVEKIISKHSSSGFSVETLVKQLCPEGVPMSNFPDCATYTRGITYNKSQEANNGEDSYKVLRANNITLGLNSLNYDDVKEVKKDVIIKPNQWLKESDILICAGSGSKEHVGKVAYIEEDMDYSFGGFMAVIRSKDNINSKFLFYNLVSKRFKDYLSSALNSTTINNLNNQVMADFSIPVPPKQVQDEIVSILDSFVSLRRLTYKLGQLRQKQYEYYREQLLTFE